MKSIVNMQNTEDKNHFLWCISADLHEIDTHRERVSHYKKYFTEPIITDTHFPLKKNKILKTK